MTEKPTTQEDLDKILKKMRKTATVRCRMIRPLAGGVPASEKGLKAFIEHHLGIPPESAEFQPAFDRIMREEIGEKDTTPEDGELKTQDVYQVNMIRSNECGPFIMEHQIKALLKQSASRLKFFQKKKGSKGDMSECSTVSACGISDDGENPWNIHLVDHEDEPAKTYYEVINGRVNSAQGPKSIQHHTQMVPEGSRFCFQLDWLPSVLTGKDIQAIVAMATQIGVGSCLSLGYGRFEVEKMEVE